MSKIKLITVLTLALAIVLTFAIVPGCRQAAAPAPAAPEAPEEPAAEPAAAEEPAAEEPSGELPAGLKAAYFASTMENNYHQADTSWAVKYGKEQYGIDVQIFDGKADNNVMAEAVDQVLAIGFDMLSVFVWEGETVKDTVREIIDNGTATAAFYQGIGDLTIPYNAISEKEASFQMGVTAATKWKEFYPDQPIVYAVIGWMENPVTKAERHGPFIDGILSVDPDAEEAARLDAAEGTEKAYQVCQDLLQARPDVNIIFAEANNLLMGIIPALEEAGRYKAVDGVPQTEIVASVDAPESEIRDIYDPTKALFMTNGLTPKENAIARIDTLVGIYTGQIPQWELVEVVTKNFYIDAWNTPVEEAVEWFNVQYAGNLEVDADGNIK
jgi:ABC-type sugar transport system substrate-binding protein